MADNTPTPVVTVTSENTDKEDRPPIITEKMDIDGTESAPKVEKEDTPTKSKENMEVETAGNVPIKDEEDETKEDGAVGGNGEASTSQEKKGDDIDLYAYTKGDKFTSEIYKIEVLNLPIRVGFGQFKKRLQSLGLKPVKVKMIDRSGNAWVTFRSDEERDEAITKCEGHTWKGRTWKAKKAAPAADPFRKRKQESENEAGPNQKMAKRDEPEISPEDRLNQAVTPLHHLSYEVQLQNKQEEIRAYLKKLGREIQYNNNDMRVYLAIQRAQNEGLICPLEPMKPSPQRNGYRNKCEFTIGKSPDGREKTVGFRLGRYNKGIVSVLEVDSCIHVPDSMKKVTKVLQTYLQDHSTYAGYDPEERSGHWRQVTLRTNQRGDIMMMVAFHPQGLKQEEVAAEREKVANYFKSGGGSGCDVTSMYFLVETDRISEPKKEEYLFGEKYIEEALLGIRFRISPAAFFQINTKAAEVLYSTVANWSCVSEKTVLLDVCCGTGTIGLTMAKNVAKVVGVELCQEAVEDAKFNAGLNEIKNAQFFCSKAEQFLPNYMQGLPTAPVVAVVDPPRGGLHSDVVRCIRKCGLIKRVVYVSCNPNGALQNIVDFTRKESKRVKGLPFRLIKAVAVDMFPHAQHCELVMLLDRELKIDEAVEEARLEQNKARDAKLEENSSSKSQEESSLSKSQEESSSSKSQEESSSSKSQEESSLSKSQEESSSSKSQEESSSSKSQEECSSSKSQEESSSSKSQEESSSSKSQEESSSSKLQEESSSSKSQEEDKSEKPISSEPIEGKVEPSVENVT